MTETRADPDPFVERLALADDHARAARTHLAWAEKRMDDHSRASDVAATFGLLSIAHSLREIALRSQVGAGDPMAAVPTTERMPAAGGGDA